MDNKQIQIKIYLLRQTCGQNLAIPSRSVPKHINIRKNMFNQMFFYFAFIGDGTVVNYLSDQVRETLVCVPYIKIPIRQMVDNVLL